MTLVTVVKVKTTSNINTTVVTDSLKTTLKKNK